MIIGIMMTLLIARHSSPAAPAGCVMIAFPAKRTGQEEGESQNDEPMHGLLGDEVKADEDHSFSFAGKRDERALLSRFR